jgi:hypothetical protein
MARASHDKPGTGTNADLLDGYHASAFQKVGTTRIVIDSYTEFLEDGMIICNKATAMTVTLLAATGGKRVLQIASINDGVVTITPDGADTINGEITQSLNNGDCMDIKDYASGKWVII